LPSHQAAFIFTPGPGDIPGQNATPVRAAKRRKIAKSDGPRPQHGSAHESVFPPLFNGAERPEAVKLRKELFDTAWPVLEDRIQVSY
jgi:origin recognition complex subunit 3